MARISGVPENYGAVTSGEFSMNDWDSASIHATSPTAVSNLIVEETLDGGTTWIQVSTTVTAIGVPLRVVVASPVAAQCRWRFGSGNGSATRVLKKRS